MAFISLPDGIKIEIVQRKGGAPVLNIVWGILRVTASLTVLENISDAVVAWWNTNVKPLATSSLTLEQVIVTDWSVEGGQQFVNDLITPSAGTAVGADLPSNVAAVVTFYTGYTGRSNRGRVYMAGMSDAAVTTNTLGTSYVTSMLTAWAAFRTDLEAVDATHVVASFYHNNEPRLVGTHNEIIEYGMNNVVDTQRRRIPKVNN